MKRLIVLTVLFLIAAYPLRTTTSPASSVAQAQEKPAAVPQPHDTKPSTDPVPYVKLPATKEAKPNRYFCLKPDTNCTAVKWIIPNGLDKIDPEIVLKNPNVGVFIGDAGTYTVTAYGALNGQASDPATCTVTIGTPPPGPTPPGPTPPGPTPPGPTPPSDLSAALQTAWAAETDPSKASNAALLAALYKAASTTTVNDGTLKTLGDLFNEMKAADGALLSTSAIPKTRAAIGTYLSAQLGTTAATPLDSTVRAKAGTAFSNVATALGGLK